MNVLSLDDWLDRTLIGYSALGYRWRGLGHDAGGRVRSGLEGHAALVTGAGGGIGEAACIGLARAGAVVHMVVRDARRAEPARERVARAAPPDVPPRVHVCDVSRLESVRAFAGAFAAAEPRLRVLVHDASVYPTRRERTPDGLEVTFATNVAGPFLLTSLLLGTLRADPPARVVTVSSGGMYSSRLRADDLQLDRADFSGGAFYGHTKRLQVILSEAAARRCPGVSFVAMHPGWVDTPGLRRALPRFRAAARRVLRDPAAGADTIVWLATAPEPALRDGGFWHDRRPRPRHRVPWTRETAPERERAWSEVARLTGAG